jgi:hypothetical protein
MPACGEVSFWDAFGLVIGLVLSVVVVFFAVVAVVPPALPVVVVLPASAGTDVEVVESTLEAVDSTDDEVVADDAEPFFVPPPQAAATSAALMMSAGKIDRERDFSTESPECMGGPSATTGSCALPRADAPDNMNLNLVSPMLHMVVKCPNGRGCRSDGP